MPRKQHSSRKKSKLAADMGEEDEGSQSKNNSLMSNDFNKIGNGSRDSEAEGNRSKQWQADSQEKVIEKQNNSDD